MTAKNTIDPDLDGQIDELEHRIDDLIEQDKGRNRSCDWWYLSKYQGYCKPELILAIIKRLRELENKQNEM